MKKKLEEEEATLARLNAKKAAVEKSIDALDNLISEVRYLQSRFPLLSTHVYINMGHMRQCKELSIFNF